MGVRWSKFPNFSEEEFRCKGSGKVEMEERFIAYLQDLRHRAGFPFIINSGYRSPEYNDEVSNSGLDGPHTTGLAADIRVHSAWASILLRLAAKDPRTGGIGIKQSGRRDGRFIHLDLLEPRIWTY